VFDGYEALAIVGILVAIFLWGPGKIPELAKSVASAKAEYDKASKQLSSFTNMNSIITSQTNPQSPTSSPTGPQAPTAQTAEDPLVVAATSLGISTEGKTKAELAKEIQAQTTTKTSIGESCKHPLARLSGGGYQTPID